MQKVYISNKISPEIAETYDALGDKLGPPKNRILEASIEVFNKLPKEMQYALKSNIEADRELCFRLIAGLSLPKKPPGPGKAAKSSR